jgi:hypothetical protein
MIRQAGLLILLGAMVLAPAAWASVPKVVMVEDYNWAS